MALHSRHPARDGGRHRPQVSQPPAGFSPRPRLGRRHIFPAGLDGLAPLGQDEEQALADARDALSDAREALLAERESLADERDTAADERARAADARDAVADERARAADDRNHAATRREARDQQLRDELERSAERLKDLIAAADARDRMAELRDRAADAREAAAVRAEQRRKDQQLDQEQERAQAAIDRGWAGEDRDAAAADRADLRDLARNDPQDPQPDG